MAGVIKPKRKKPSSGKFTPTRSSRIETIEEPEEQGSEVRGQGSGSELAAADPAAPAEPSEQRIEVPLHGLLHHTIEVPLETARVLLYADRTKDGWHGSFECALPGLPLGASKDGRGSQGPPRASDTAAVLAAADYVIGYFRELLVDARFQRASHQRQIDTATAGLIKWRAEYQKRREEAIADLVKYRAELEPSDPAAHDRASGPAIHGRLTHGPQRKTPPAAPPDPAAKAPANGHKQPASPKPRRSPMSTPAKKRDHSSEWQRRKRREAARKAQSRDESPETRAKSAGSGPSTLDSPLSEMDSPLSDELAELDREIAAAEEHVAQLKQARGVLADPAVGSIVARVFRPRKAK